MFVFFFYQCMRVTNGKNHNISMQHTVEDVDGVVDVARASILSSRSL